MKKRLNFVVLATVLILFPTFIEAQISESFLISEMNESVKKMDDLATEMRLLDSVFRSFDSKIRVFKKSLRKGKRSSIVQEESIHKMTLVYNMELSKLLQQRIDAIYRYNGLSLTINFIQKN